MIKNLNRKNNFGDTYHYTANQFQVQLVPLHLQPDPLHRFRLRHKRTGETSEPLTFKEMTAQLLAANPKGGER